MTPEDDPGGMTFDDASIALARANSGDNPTHDPVSGLPLPDAPSQPAAPEPPPAGTQQPPPQEATTPVVDSFTGVDLSGLPPETAQQLQGRLAQIQSDYTQKTQEIANWRALQEAGFGPEAAVEALQFQQSLMNDPQYAQQVYGELGRYLETNGLNQQQQPQQQPQQPQTDEFGFQIEDDQAADPVQQQLSELLTWKQQQEQLQQVQNFVAQVEEQARQIRTADPSLTDQDLDRIMAIAPGTNGDLMAAHREYVSWRDAIVKGYLEQKSSVPLGTPTSTGPGQTPPHYETLEDGHRAAQEHLRRVLADEG